MARTATSTTIYSIRFLSNDAVLTVIAALNFHANFKVAHAPYRLQIPSVTTYTPLIFIDNKKTMFETFNCSLSVFRLGMTVKKQHLRVKYMKINNSLKTQIA